MGEYEANMYIKIKVPSYFGSFKDVCTLQWPYMDVTMTIFHVFPRYKKINKMKFIEILKKGFIYLKSS
jgi:hypothetical protein